ncbi:MAG: hypothetical protein KME16_21175 [Scytolyngbya sp. HA4215-MV1]|nr:hypothetical protein [Scytolyngbya sp. HA4215-MV1]
MAQNDRKTLNGIESDRPGNLHVMNSSYSGIERVIRSLQTLWEVGLLCGKQATRTQSNLWRGALV